MVYSTFFSILYILSVPIGIVGLVQLFFALLSYSVFSDGTLLSFSEAGFISLFFAFILRAFTQVYRGRRINAQAALLFTVLTWVGVCVISGIPFIFIAGMDFTHAIFESMSALTTTGATVLVGLDEMPKSFLLYRQFLQWFGGLGVVIFVVAVLPMLNVGGMQLLKSETPGPVKDEKLAPRVVHSAQYLWTVYIGLTFLCTLGYWAAGMSLYDAFAHSLSTISTGGFSTHDASLGYFQSQWVNIVADIFMLAGAVAFPLHFYFYRKMDFGIYARDSEFRAYLLVIFAFSILVLFSFSGGASNISLLGFSSALFNVISFMTSTGFTVASINDWPSTVLLLLIVAGFLGGCAGSTAGGGKIIRFILVGKLIHLQLKRAIHPSGAFAVKYKGAVVSEQTMSSTMAFFFLVILVNIVCVLAVMYTGLDFWTALSAVSTCQNVVGPAFGSLGNNFSPASEPAMWVFTFCMLLGRLEYFTVLVIFSRRFWRT